MRGKHATRGQVTLFVVLGLVLLVLIGLGFALFSHSSEQTGKFDTQQVRSYVESCLALETKNALITIGHQGGYADLSRFQTGAPGDGTMFSDGPQSVPYWYYMKTCESTPGCIVFSPPPLCDDNTCVYNGDFQGSGVSIQSQVELLVENALPSCVNDLASLDTFTLLSANAPSVHVIFTADDVRATAKWDLEIQDDETNEQTTLHEFSSVLDIDFEETYRLARDILALEYQTQFIEENFLHYLSVYQGDPPLLPPFNGAEFLGGRKVWIRTQAQQQIETEILPYLNFMQLLNAYQGYSPFQAEDVDPDYQEYVRGLFAYSDIIIPNVTYPRHAASFLYPYAPIYLNINDDEVLKGRALDGGNFFMKLAGVFIRQYEHKYDVTWPMLISLKDVDAFGGEGYMFTFAMEANIINNFPMYADRTITTIDERSGFFDAGEPGQHPQGEYTLRVTDKRTNEPINEALVTYECGWEYIAGATNEQGLWQGTLPYCAVGGALRAEKALEYFHESTPYNNKGLGGTGALSLWPFEEKEVVLYRIPAASLETCTNPVSCRQPLSWGEQITYDLALDNESATSDECTNCTNQTRALRQNQYAMIMFTTNDTQTIMPLPNTLVFGKEGQDVSLRSEDVLSYIDQLNLTPEEEATLRAQATTFSYQTTLVEKQTMQLVPGSYYLNGLLFFDEPITVPKEKRREGGLFGSSYTLPELTLPTWLQGGVSYQETPLSFSANDVYGNNRLVVYVIEQPLPTSWKILEDYKTVEEYQVPYLHLLTPQFEAKE